MTRAILQEITDPQRGYVGRFTRRDSYNPFSNKSIFNLEVEDTSTGAREIREVGAGYARDVTVHDLQFNRHGNLGAKVIFVSRDYTTVLGHPTK